MKGEGNGMVKRIYQELVYIKKELQAIRSNLESKETKDLNIDSLKKGIEGAFIHPTLLTPNSIARQLRPEQNDE